MKIGELVEQVKVVDPIKKENLSFPKDYQNDDWWHISNDNAPKSSWCGAKLKGITDDSTMDNLKDDTCPYCLMLEAAYRNCPVESLHCVNGEIKGETNLN